MAVPALRPAQFKPSLEVKTPDFSKGHKLSVLKNHGVERLREGERFAQEPFPERTLTGAAAIDRQEDHHTREQRLLHRAHLNAAGTHVDTDLLLIMRRSFPT